MAVTITLGAFAAAQEHIDSATAATAAPTGDAASIYTSSATTMRTYVDYTGDPTAGSLTIWCKENGVWYEGESKALAPPGSEYQDWDIRPKTEIAVQLDAVTFTTSGTVSVLVR